MCEKVLQGEVSGRGNARIGAIVPGRHERLVKWCIGGDELEEARMYVW